MIFFKIEVVLHKYLY